MMTIRVTAACLVTIAACIAGIYADDAVPNECGVNQCTKCSGDPPTCVECNRRAQYTIDNSTTPASCVRVCPWIGGCLVCQGTGDDARCIQCMARFALLDNGQCRECKTYSGCNSCSNDTVCELCVDCVNTGPKRDGTAQCGDCGQKCRRCTVAGAGLCDYCSEGKPEPYNGLCVCAENCVDCSINGYTGCDTCIATYGLVGGAGARNTCQQCPDNCKNCDHVPSGKCATCLDGYGLDTTDFTCKNCQTTDICNNNGNCRSTKTGYTCACNPGHSGAHCEL